MLSLVTGAAGFLGRHVTERLLAGGHPVRAMVRNADQAAALRNGGAEVVAGDIRDPAAVRSAVQGADCVYHCAAAVAASYSRDEIYAINLGGTRNVLDALREAGRGRIVLVSSINVLGTRDLKGPSEDLPCRRENEPKGDVKVDAEQLAVQYHRQHGVDVVIIRPALIYGPGENNTPKLLRTIRRGKFAYIGSHENIIPMVHVDDAAQAVVLAGTTAAASGRVYNISDGAPVTAREFIGYLAQLSDCPPPKKVLPYFVPYLACTAFEWLNRLRIVRGSGPINRVGLRFLGTSRPIDISRAKKELGYEPKIGFRDGLAATVRWIQAHPSA